MRGKGHAKFTDHDAVLAQYELVQDEPSDDGISGDEWVEAVAIEAC